MGNCLVTKLKGTVDNDNLKVLNSYILEINTDTVFNIDFTPGGSKLELFADGGYFGTSSDSINLTYKEISPWTPQTIYVQGSFKLRVQDNYTGSFKMVVGGAGATNANKFVIDADDVKYRTGFTYLSAPFKNGSTSKPFSTLNPHTLKMYNMSLINLDDFSRFTGTHILAFHTQKTIGRLSSLGHAVSLETMDLGTSINISVNDGIKEFVAAQYDAGRTSGAIYFLHALDYVYLNIGHSNDAAYLKWDSRDKCTVANNANLTSATKIYAVGYSESDSQVTEWRNAGKTVVIIS